MLTIGQAIKNIRTHRNTTQAEFAKGLGASQNTISQYEAGKLFPSRSILILLLQMAEGEDEKKVFLRALGMKFISDQSNLYDYLKQIMEDAGMDRNELADAVGVPVWELEEFEAGVVPPMHVVDKLKSVAVRAGRPDLALQLTDGKWKVRSVFHPGETFISKRTSKNVSNLEKRSLARLASETGVDANDPIIEILRFWDLHQGRSSSLEVFRKLVTYLQIELGPHEAPVPLKSKEK